MNTSSLQQPESTSTPVGKAGSSPSTSSPSLESPELLVPDPDSAFGDVFGPEHGDPGSLPDPDGERATEDRVSCAARTCGDPKVQPPLTRSSVSFTIGLDDLDEPPRLAGGNDQTSPEDYALATPSKATRLPREPKPPLPARLFRPSGRRTEHALGTPYTGEAITPLPVTPVSTCSSTQPDESSAFKLREARDQVDSLHEELRRLKDEAAAQAQKVDEGLRREAILLQNQSNLALDRTQSEDTHRSLHLQDRRELDLLQERVNEQKAENVRLASHRAQQHQAQIAEIRNLQEESSRQTQELINQTGALTTRDQEIAKLKAQVEGNQSALNVTEARLHQFSNDLRAEKSTHQANLSTFRAASHATNQRHANVQKSLQEERDRIGAEKVTLLKAKKAAEEATAQAEAEKTALFQSQQRATRERTQADAEKTALVASQQRAERELARIQAEQADLLVAQHRVERERAQFQTDNAALLASKKRIEEEKERVEAEKASLLTSQRWAETERARAESERDSFQSAHERAEKERALAEKDNAALLASRKRIEQENACLEAQKADLLDAHRLAEEAAARKSQQDTELLDAVAILTARFDNLESSSQQPPI
ncbi:MAG: hypothetical protein GY822_06135, partial [Deltaproteobacteria bacterium]|nr:hypothetical protein [Deltaproteobacteria bacterium]